MAAGVADKPKGNPTKIRRGKKAPLPKHAVWLTNDDGEPVDWKDENQVARKVEENIYAYNGRDVEPSEYIEARALNWLRELEHIGVQALKGDEPDYDLAAKVRLALLKFSSVNRQRIDLSAQIAMTAPTNLSDLSEDELRAIELGSPEQLNELALRIDRLRSAKKITH